MATSKGTHRLGQYPVWLNRNGTVVIWCPVHEVWVVAANAGRHFGKSHPVNDI